MLLDVNDSQLVLVDFQAKLMPAIADGAAVLRNAQRLAQLARLLRVPAVLTEHCPDKLGPSDAALLELVPQRLDKESFSAVPAGLVEALLPRPQAKAPQGNARSLPKHLRKPEVAEPERRSIVLAGCEAHVCLLQTALDLLDEEWDVWVVTDACGSRTDRNRDAAYDRLAGAGAELVTCEMVAFEWVRDASHPQWKDVLALIK
ncbi:isochorismatase [Comamonas serinivorans]|uniref:Isochorismatase n=1 Tax=Comamonas serinivorans TaxID=1082851 RepID=A0A1Y0EL59_9BURK|nr:isochorismatase family protein [Comamonas serinivorans]ARU04327.1 isochorismatase [Comamonas serinivorans]